MQDVVIGGVDITKELIEEFQSGAQLEAVKARARQLAAAREGQARGPVREHAVGRTVYRIDPYWYHYWGQREGYDIWKDRAETERFARDTPEMRVEQARPARVCGFRGQRSEVRGQSTLAATGTDPLLPTTGARPVGGATGSTLASTGARPVGGGRTRVVWDATGRRVDR